MKNIIVFLLDTARASDVDGNRRLRTISYLSRKGTTYTNAIAPGTWTAPSHASLFTDRKVSAIGGVSRNFFSKGSSIDPWMVKTKFLRGTEPTIAEKMHRLGYYSVLFSNNPFLSSFTNLAIGFDRVFDTWLTSNLKYNRSLVEKVSFIINGGATARSIMFQLTNIFSRLMPQSMLDGLYLRLRERLFDGVAKADGTYRLDRGADDINEALEGYLQNDRFFQPNFIFANYIEAHENYPIGRRTGIRQDKWLYLSGIEEMTPDATKALHNGYVKRLEYLDKKVGGALQSLKGHGMLDDAAVVITSDHGQLFGEHGMLYHAMPPYHELVRVPLIAANFRNGKIVDTNERVEKPVSLNLLHNALLDLASGKEQYLNGQLRGSRHAISEHTGIVEGWDEGLLRMLKPRSKNAELIYSAKSRFNRKATAVYSGDMKLIHNFGNGKDELYDISKDSSESDNIIDNNRLLANRLARLAG